MDFTPRIIFWELTKRCNLKCGYCRMVTDNGQELTTTEAFQIIRDIKDMQQANRPPILVLSGGEPLLREDFFEILEYCFSLGIRPAVATNGVFLNNKVALGLKEMNVVRVSLSLDSVDEEVHDACRGCIGAFRKTLYAAGTLRKHGIPFQINYTVTKLNKANIKRVAEFAVTFGAIAVHYFILVPVGCGKLIEQSSALDALDNEEVLTNIKELSAKFSIELQATCAPQYVRFTDNASGCIAGTAAFFISAQGDVYPCGYLPVKAGSVRSSSISEIWNDSLVFKNLRENNLKGSCAHCYVKNRCRGCRARAFSLTGDYLAQDQNCVLAKEEVTA